VAISRRRLNQDACIRTKHAGGRSTTATVEITFYILLFIFLNRASLVCFFCAVIAASTAISVDFCFAKKQDLVCS
ncbi:MAG: hypothetical protein ABJQ14_09400, partial [Hyphomicrobiales bacterium]